MSMTQRLEDYLPYVKMNGGIKTELPVTLSGTAANLDVGGTSRSRGVHTFDVAPVFTIAPVAARQVNIDSSSATPTLGGSGSINIAKKGSATQTYTLPAATTAGLWYTFVCGHASGELLINPATGEKIVTLTWAAIGADADTGQISNTTTGIKNTAATNVLGDNITLVSDGVDTWFGLGMPTGIWATQ